MATTAVTKARINLPADINKELAEEVARIQSRISAPSGDRITVTNSKTFKLPNGQEVDEILAVIVDFAAVNLYYTEAYDRNNVTPPACFALGLEPAGLTPSENSPDVQAGSCASCWANQFGSAGKGKACQNTRLLALLPLDATEDTPLVVLKVSPTAIRAFDGHVSAVARKYGLPVRAVITRFYFSQDSDYATLRFADEGLADKNLVLLAQSRKEEALQRVLTEPDVSAATTTAKPVKGPARRGAARR